MADHGQSTDPEPHSMLDKTLAGVAKFIMSPECKSIAVLTGAGCSVAAGIPDFRSPGGLYSTLQPEKITATPQQRAAMTRDPMSVVMREMFFANALPYLEVRRPFILGTRERTWQATAAHRFMELLHVHTGKLTRVYTQNIDGLDFQCEDLPTELIVPVHGSIGRVACESCGHEVDFNSFCDDVSRSIKDIYNVDDAAPPESTPIACASCSKPTVKPTTVLFGSELPAEFFTKSAEDLPQVDLLIVAGTSLVVSPANSVVYRVPETAVRLIVNDEPVGAELGVDYGPDAKRDVFARGECDAVFLELMRHLSWLQHLDVDQLPEASKQRLLEMRAW